MHTVDRYLLKNIAYIFVLANILAFIPRGAAFFVGLNAVALAVALLLFYLIRLTVRRYAAEFAREQGEVKDLLGRYIEDEKRGKVSFHNYLKGRIA